MPTNPSKPQALGRRAREIAQELDVELAAVDRELTDQYNGHPMGRAEYQLIAARVRHKIEVARRKVMELLTLGAGTGPLPSLDERNER